MADLICSPNAAVAYDFFVRMGLLDFQAAAIVGNVQAESGVNPHLEAVDSNGLPSRGIAMWQPLRWQRLLEFAAGRDPWTLETQLAFLWHELQTVPALGMNQLSASATLEDATVVFQNKFERCGVCHTENRIRYARSVLLSCPAIRSPLVPSKTRNVAVASSIFALAVAAGYGAWKAITRRARS